MPGTALFHTAICRLADEILTNLNIKITVLRDVTPFSLVASHDTCVEPFIVGVENKDGRIE